MAGMIIETFFIGMMIVIGVGIGAGCLEMVMRLMARRLSSERVTETTLKHANSQ